MNAAGHNPMRWDCAKRGCFNVKMRPKIEAFCDIFPRSISFGDVDGMVEVNGRLLILEWKSSPMDIDGSGPARMYQKITTGTLISVIYIVGNAETMEISHAGWFRDGVFSGWADSSLKDVRNRIKGWCSWAKQHYGVWPK